jgi:adenylosuccinate synthase
MAVTVVIGGQYGGEGKGKIVSHLALKDNIDYVVRCGGPNSGHTVDFGGKRYRLRLLPAGFINSKSRLLLAAGALVNMDILRQEMEICGVDHPRIGIDYNTAIITEKEIRSERELGLLEKIGSTLSGTGFAVASRVLRNGSIKLAKDVPDTKPFLTNVSEELNAAIDRGEKVVIEGTQGFGLSLYHGMHYPYATSRDTTAAAFLSEVGVSPLRMDTIIMAVRTYPIRVSGNSGPLRYEITWEELQKRSGYPYRIEEFSTNTERPRRIASFDLEIVKMAAMVNRPTQIALHGTDYLDYNNKGLTDFDGLCDKAKQFIEWLEEELGVPVDFIGTGPTNEELIDRRHERQSGTDSKLDIAVRPAMLIPSGKSRE